jgi:predicted secreted protein
MVRTFIQVLALSVVLISSFFLIKGTLTLSTNDLVMLSSTKWGYDLAVARNLCHQRADTVVGFILLLLAFFLQLWNMLWSMRWKDFTVNKTGVITALIVSALVFLIAYGISDFLYKKSYSQIKEILTQAEK